MTSELATTEQGLSTTLAADSIRAIHEKLSEALTVATEAEKLIREAAGTSPNGMAAELTHYCQLGCGHIRHTRDLLSAAWRKRNTLTEQSEETVKSTPAQTQP